MKKKALIFGISGMDGSHLADLLLEKDYEVFGVYKSLDSNNDNSLHLLNNINFLQGDITNKKSIRNIIKESQPDEIYNLAAQSRVEDSWSASEVIGNTIGLGPLRILESIIEINKDIRFFQALSSEMFGRMVDNPCTEDSPFYPKTPYGAAKLYAYWMCKNYREIYDMHNSTGILFNHESERRKKEFLSRKVTSGVAKIYLGLEDKLSLGSIEGYRDWSYAPDFVEAMWLMLQQETPDDYILCSSKVHSIKDLITESFKVVGINDWDNYITKDEKFYRPAEVETIIGDNSKAKEKLGWEPKTSFSQMINNMVKNDIKILQK